MLWRKNWKKAVKVTWVPRPSSKTKLYNPSHPVATGRGTLKYVLVQVGVLHAAPNFKLCTWGGVWKTRCWICWGFKTRIRTGPSVRGKSFFFQKLNSTFMLLNLCSSYGHYCFPRGFLFYSQRCCHILASALAQSCTRQSTSAEPRAAVYSDLSLLQTFHVFLAIECHGLCLQVFPSHHMGSFTSPPVTVRTEIRHNESVLESIKWRWLEELRWRPNLASALESYALS